MIKNILFNPLSPKKIAKLLFLFLSVFFLFHTAVWFLFTKQILDTPLDTRVGDLARLSYQLDSMQLRETSKLTLPQQHIEAKDWKEGPVDIITIGDSFSNGGAGGINPYYQDYIASIYNKNILNISPSKMDNNYIETLMSLYHNGVLDEIKPKLIILESVERSAITRFSKSINWDYILTRQQSNFNFKHSIFNQHKQNNISIINTGNYKFIINPLIYKWSSKPIACSGVYQMALKDKLFSNNTGKTLLFHSSALDSIPLTTQKNITKLNNNLNILSDYLKKKNIILAFMPVVDKYNLYEPYISKNSFPKSTFFEKLRPLHKNYYLIDTKAILYKKLPNEKDIFYADDTHWNFMASEAVARSLSPIIKGN